LSPEEEFIRHWLTLPDRPDIEEDELPLFMDWLAQSGPDEWHRWVINWNWDYGIDLIEWVISQEACDKGTALSAYYLGQPDYYTKFESVAAVRADASDAEVVDLFLAICRNWETGLYRTYQFEPDEAAKEYLSQGPVAMKELAVQVPWHVPDDMAAAIIEGEPNDFNRVIDGVSLAMLQAKQNCGLEPDGVEWD